MRAYNYGGSGRNLMKFYQGMWLIVGVIMSAPILQGAPPAKFGRVKNVQNLARFLTTYNQVSISSRFLDNGHQTYWGHDLDISRSRDVIGHVTIRFPSGHFL